MTHHEDFRFLIFIIPVDLADILVYYSRLYIWGNEALCERYVL